MDKIHVVAGPTASGKTNLAIKLASQHNGELINVDSRQIYKYLDIGTNKGLLSTAPELPRWKYPRFFADTSDQIINLVSFLDPDKNFDAFTFRDLVYQLVGLLLEKGKTPILVGGSGLYLQTILRPNEYTVNVQADPKLRKKLKQKSVSELQQMLSLEELNKLNESDSQNPRRLVRAIEKSQSKPRQSSENKYPEYEFEKHYLEPNLDNLEKKLKLRAEQMVFDGIVDEVERVLEMGFSEECVGLQGIGYREVLKYIHGELTTQLLAEEIYIAHRQYAKKQMTWFRKYFY